MIGDNFGEFVNLNAENEDNNNIININMMTPIMSNNRLNNQQNTSCPVIEYLICLNFRTFQSDGTL